MFDGLMNGQEQDTVSSFLERAMHLIEDQRHWCQRNFSQILDGVWQYCALGALEHTGRGEGSPFCFGNPLGFQAQHALNAAAAQMGLVADAALVNDMFGHAAVMEMYRRAIKAARVKEHRDV